MMNRWFPSFLIVLCTLLLSYGCSGSGGSARRVVKDCLDCHAEYQTMLQHDRLHDPLKGGTCNGCHRNHGLLGGVYLNTAENELCFKCHQQITLNG